MDKKALIMSNNTPRVLVSTVGAWSDSVGSNTMSELFRDYPKDKLACLYIRSNRSDSKSCYRYFHIFEGRVMKSILHRNMITSEEYMFDGVQGNNKDLEEEKARYSKYRQKRNWPLLIVREFVWMLGHWKSKELDKFLDDFNPEVLVCPIESYLHFNRINEYIIRRKQPRVIGFLWDDNFTYKQQPHSLGYKIHRWWLRHSVRRLVAKCEKVVALSPKMKKEVDAEFGIDSLLLTKPIFDQPPFTEYKPKEPIRMLYTGNLYVGRDETLALIVDAIKDVNKAGQKVILDVYTSTIIKKELEDRIKIDGCCVVHDPISQSEVLRLQKETDVLLFIESLKQEGGDARLSFSTKITDYFCAGKCIWAVGSNHLSAIDYLEKQDAALCSLSKEDILPMLERMICDKTVINDYAYKGWQCGHDKHDAKMITEKLSKIIFKTTN